MRVIGCLILARACVLHLKLRAVAIVEDAGHTGSCAESCQRVLHAERNAGASCAAAILMQHGRNVQENGGVRSATRSCLRRLIGASRKLGTLLAKNFI